MNKEEINQIKKEIEVIRDQLDTLYWRLNIVRNKQPDEVKASADGARLGAMITSLGIVDLILKDSVFKVRG